MNSEQKRLARDVVHAGAGGRCAYCGVSTGKRRGTLDHYMPLALGGTDRRSNLRWACLTCNASKGSMHPDEWERVRPKKAAGKTKHEVRCEVISAAIQRHRPPQGQLIVHVVTPSVIPSIYKQRARRLTVSGWPGWQFMVDGTLLKVVAWSKKP